MRKRNPMPIVALLLASFVATPTLAQQSDEATLDILVATIQANKKALVAVNLGLADGEAQAFWPVYDRYQQDLAGVRDRFRGVIEEYTANFRTMGDEKALEAVERYLAVDRDRNQVRRRYLKDFSAVLPGRKLARFYQIENKVDAVLRYQLAQDVPVIEE